MDSQVLHVMTISNSIIGVSLLAMPYCFKQCGIILSILILIASSILSRLSCHLLLKSAIIARRRTFEVLAYHTFGSFGKFMTEIGIIGFLIGTCIAFFVIMGDLGPTIVAKMTGTNSSDTMRTSILMALALFCVLPLGLLRNVDSLSSVCTVTIGFYFCLVLKIIVEALPHLFSADWIDKVELWRPSGILQCLPIFSMALSCQTQIFEIYQVVQNASLEKMNNLIRVAINICTCVYIFVGTFGYIAFCNQTFTGNILMNFSSSFVSDAIKFGFVLSVAFSFPLVIFPCRASLNSLLYKQTYTLHEGTDKYIPESRFKGITFVIIFIPLVIGIMIPNIELVLGLMGSTIGIMICVIFPATCFICISTKNTNERVLAQIMLFFGILIMVLGTYANLFTIEARSDSTPLSESVKLDQDIPKVHDISFATKPPDIPNNIELKLPETIDKVLEPPKQAEIEKIARHEPPQPQAPPDSDTSNKKIQEKSVIQKVETDAQNNNVKPPDIKNEKLPEVIESRIEPAQSQKVIDSKVETNKTKVIVQEKMKVQNQPSKPDKLFQGDSKIGDNKKQQDEPPLQQMEIRHEPPQPIEPLEPKVGNTEPKKLGVPENKPPPPIIDEKPESKIQDSVNPKESDQVNADKNGKPEKEKNPVVHELKHDELEKQVVDIEAIKKEDKELLEQEKAELTEEEKKNQQLLQTLEKQNKEQQKLVEESKKVLEEIKQRQQVLEEKKQKVIEKEKIVQQKEDADLKVEDNKKNNIETKKDAEKDNLKLNKGNLLPLPIILSNTFNNEGTNVKNIKEEVVPEKSEQVNNIAPQFNNKPDVPEANKEKLNNENELPVLHREIRSANAKELEITKEVCDTQKKSVSAADEPLIKMDMRLSDPEFVNIKGELNDVNGKIEAEAIKPLSRDLKSYKVDENN